LLSGGVAKPQEC